MNCVIIHSINEIPKWLTGHSLAEVKSIIENGNTALVAEFVDEFGIGSEFQVQSDGGEIEDQTLLRDWDWIPALVKRAYEAGYEHGHISVKGDYDY
jgi:hypothetical protein